MTTFVVSGNGDDFESNAGESTLVLDDAASEAQRIVQEISRHKPRGAIMWRIDGAWPTSLGRIGGRRPTRATNVRLVVSQTSVYAEAAQGRLGDSILLSVTGRPSRFVS